MSNRKDDRFIYNFETMLLLDRTGKTQFNCGNQAVRYLLCLMCQAELRKGAAGRRILLN